jgi:hypothetical protein
VTAISGLDGVHDAAARRWFARLLYLFAYRAPQRSFTSMK